MPLGRHSPSRTGTLYKLPIRRNMRRCQALLPAAKAWRQGPVTIPKLRKTKTPSCKRSECPGRRQQACGSLEQGQASHECQKTKTRQKERGAQAKRPELNPKNRGVRHPWSHGVFSGPPGMRLACTRRASNQISLSPFSPGARVSQGCHLHTQGRPSEYPLHF